MSTANPLLLFPNFPNTMEKNSSVFMRTVRMCQIIQFYVKVPHADW